MIRIRAREHQLEKQKVPDRRGGGRARIFDTEGLSLEWNNVTTSVSTISS
jgi:hypothetical protein